jgi:hypothetical protein
MLLFAGGLKFTGAIEVISAVLLVVPSLAFFGALRLVATMVGAILTHLFIIGGNPAVPIALLASTATIASVRRNVRWNMKETSEPVASRTAVRYDGGLRFLQES